MTSVRTNATDGRKGDATQARIWRDRSFLVLFLAEAQSTVGDQLARVALSVLVFERTNSAAATALTYAATFLPAIVGGSLLARLGDSMPRRSVMIAADVLRAALVECMAFSQAPTWVIIALLVVAVAIGPVFQGAEVGVLAAELTAEQFRTATGLRMIMGQVSQVGGFALGGVAVAAVQPRGALLLDAASYLISAALLATLLRSGRETARVAADDGGGTMSPVEAMRWMATSSVRGPVALAWLAGFFVVPEGLAIPIARHLHATTTEAGLLLAAIPLGGAIGAVVLLRVVPRRRRRATASSMAVLAGIPLVATAVSPPIAVLTLLWGVSGALAAYQVEVVTVIVRSLPAHIRSQLLGLLQAGLITAQGVGLIVFGLVAQLSDPRGAVALAGVLGALCATGLVMAGRSEQRSTSGLTAHSA